MTTGLRAGTNLLRDDDGERVARRAAQTLGQLRGLAAKVGQMGSYIDGVIPENKQGAYAKWLATLRDQAPRSSISAIFDTIEAEFGKSALELFADFNPEPVASASIGQVHRATTKNGNVVAVKVQHPGIAEAMENDLKNAGLIESLLGRVGGLRKFNSKAVLEEIRMRFREELDYLLEAERQTMFAGFFEKQPQIVVPRVYHELTSTRVLTTEWVDGLNFESACAADEQQRRLWTQTLWQFVYQANLVGGHFNADPHPGNYMFRPDGQIAFLDFGCVQAIPPDKVALARWVHWYARHQDDVGFNQAVCDLLELKGGRYQESALDYVRACFRPLFESPFQVDRSYVADLVSRMKVMIKEYRRGTGDGYVPLPEGLFFVNRLQFGFYSVLARLDVKTNYAQVEERFITKERLQ
ncbi:MAG: AarF/ABC1/UbiB kinase family protein [Myxococcota bacterium]|nr:AarF/ABC1/UbiB kinase family protein [Myxococcota bacterium]